jgi:hypothetical protein
MLNCTSASSTSLLGATDWDTVQWLEHCRTELADLTPDEIRDSWSIYQLTLVTETAELCGLFESGE